jgi:hypothetical protein
MPLLGCQGSCQAEDIAKVYPKHQPAHTIVLPLAPLPQQQRRLHSFAATAPILLSFEKFAMRQTLRQWHAKLFLGLRGTPPARRYHPPSRRPLDRWQGELRGRKEIVEAYTRGEAKALLKKVFGVAIDGTLPAGVAVTKLPPDEAAAA